ncbi:MAG: prolyl oligopeptidase family serine peptidase [Parasporobacterium sp.]|nr:prolyl oligopeptidase family serine peptidase [Parasporobacterium sp.]
MKKFLVMIMALIVSFCMAIPAAAEEPAADSQGQESAGESAGESAEGESQGEHGGPRGDSNGGSGGMQNDETVQAALDEVAGTFIQETFTDPDTGVELEYSLFIPVEYSEDQSYPMIMFIPDATGSGKSAEDIVSSYYGAAVWATEEEQAKHPSFVFVPAFTETVVDDNWNTSDQIETAVKAIRYLTETYSIDTDRLYTTGQSMGCMTSLYLNSRYPDLFAASMYVSGQWDISVLGNMTDQTFFYITSAGDNKASGGQSEVMAMFEEAGVSYTYGEWNCQEENQSELVSELIAEGLPANMVRFEAQYTDESGNEQTLGHMQSFNYGYKLEAVRDWLFAQSK